MRDQGFSSSTRFMVDEAVVDLMQWVEAKAAERTIGTVDGKQPDPRKNQGWVPKYGSIADILAEYEAPAPEPVAIDRDEIAALVDALTEHADVEF